MIIAYLMAVKYGNFSVEDGIRDHILQKKNVEKTRIFRMHVNTYTGFPVPFNECIYQLLNEYWPTGI